MTAHGGNLFVMFVRPQAQRERNVIRLRGGALRDVTKNNCVGDWLHEGIAIGHFRVHLSLHFKARLSANSLL